MRSSRLFALVAAISLCAPSMLHAQITEKWRTIPAGQYRFIGDVGDLNGDGIRDLLTGESPSPDGDYVGVRAAASGALQAQSSARYQASGFAVIDLDGDGPKEILFNEAVQGRLVCLPFSGSPGPMTPRWSLLPFSGNAPFIYFLADLDGNGHQYVVFQAQSFNGEFEVYTRMGALFAQFQPNRPFGWVLDNLDIGDYDGDGRDEILLVYRDPDGIAPGHHLVMYESNVPVGVAPRPDGLSAVELGPGMPNPATEKSRIAYTVPARGPVTLRLLDVGGREVRVLVNGVMAPGRHEAIWDGRDANGRSMAPGAYFYELTAGGVRLGRRVIRLP